MKINHKSVQLWMSKGLLKCLMKQKELYYKASKLPKDHEIIKEYKNYRSLLQKIIRKAKMSYYSDKCIDFKNNTKILWNVINKLTEKTINKHDIIDSLNIDHKIVKEQLKIANEFGEYFSSVCKVYAEKTPKPEKSCDDYINHIAVNEKSLFLYPTNTLEITTIINSLKNKKSAGIDDISNDMIKKLKNSLAEPMTIIFNKSLSEGVFPEG